MVYGIQLVGHKISFFLCHGLDIQGSYLGLIPFNPLELSQLSLSNMGVEFEMHNNHIVAHTGSLYDPEHSRHINGMFEKMFLLEPSYYYLEGPRTLSE